MLGTFRPFINSAQPNTINSENDHLYCYQPLMYFALFLQRKRSQLISTSCFEGFSIMSDSSHKTNNVWRTKAKILEIRPVLQT